MSISARALLIANVQAGGGRAEKSLREFVSELLRGGIPVDQHVTTAPGDATSVARAAVGSYELVLVAGGDGTVNEVLNGVAGTGTPLGILPAGTQNVLAGEFGISDRPRDAAHVILEGNLRTLDLGCANGRYFVLMAGIGFDAHVASRVRPEVKKLFGSGAYVLTALAEALSYEPQPIAVEIDGVLRSTGYFVVVGNSRHYTRFFELTPLSSMQDGLLDVSVFTNRDLLQLVKYALASPVAPASRFPEVEMFQGSTIRLTAPREVLAHVDAEILGTTPIEISTAAGALRLCVPPDAA